MAKKESPKQFLDKFISLLEKQTEELENFAKPFLEQQKEAEASFKPIVDFQQNLLKQYLGHQRKWTENVIETTNRLLDQISDEQVKRAEESEKLMSEIGAPSQQFARYVKNIQTMQKAWLDQLKNTTEMMESFLKQD